VRDLPFALSDTAEPPYEGWDSIPDASELFDFRQPDCISSLGRRPTAKEIVYLPGKLRDEIGTEYDNGWGHFAGLGMVGAFGATANLVLDPEDLTTANWSVTDAVCTLSDYYWGGRRFSLIASSAANGRAYQTIAFAGNAVKVVSLVLRKGTEETDCSIRIYDNTGAANRLRIDLNWTTQAITETTGSLVKANWYAGNTIVELLLLTTAITAASTHYLLIRPSVAGAGDLYVTAVQVEDNAFPRPYAPTSRAAGYVQYTAQSGATGTVECWVRPWFTYDGASCYLWCFGLGVDNQIALQYNSATDKFMARLRIDAGNYRAMESTDAIASNAALRVWHHIKVVWDIPNQTVQLFVNGVEQTDDSSAGAVDTLVPAAIFMVGARGDESNPADSLITDLLWQDGVEDESTDHYDNDQPWYDPSEVANAEQSVRISKKGIRLHNAALTITDDINRYIGISNAEGMLARDAAGVVIHDIPNAPILTDMTYGGHLMFKTAASYVSQIQLSYTDVQTTRTATSAITNVDISSVLPAGLTNVKAVLAACALRAEVAAAKVNAQTAFAVLAVYSTAYNVTASLTNYLAYFRVSSQAAVWIRHQIVVPCLLPVFWVAGVPYVTWQLRIDFGLLGITLMTANNANYLGEGSLYVLGPLA
jgi:hypothetical protein